MDATKHTKTFLELILVLGVGLIVVSAAFASYYVSTSPKVSSLGASVTSLQGEVGNLNYSLASLQLAQSADKSVNSNLTMMVLSLQSTVSQQSSLLGTSNKTVVGLAIKVALGRGGQVNFLNFTAKYAGYIVVSVDSSYNNTVLLVDDNFAACPPAAGYEFFCVTHFSPSLNGGPPDLVPVLPGQVVLSLLNGNTYAITASVTVIYYS